MKKTQVLEIIVKNIRENLEDLQEEIDPKRSMIDYGANSLDIVEIVSQSIRDIGIKVPRTELMNLKSIDELAEVLTNYSNQQAP